MKQYFFQYKRSLKRSFFLYGLFLLSGLSLISCNKVSEQPSPEVPKGKYAQGVLIANEGAFRSGSGTVTFYDPSTKKAEQDVFKKVNKRVLGNILQSVTAYGDKIYAVINNAQKIEVVSGETFASTAVIKGLFQPRYFLGINPKKAYVSQWGKGGVTGSVQVIDLQTFTVSKTIAVGKGPGRLLKIGKQVFVVCAGGYGKDKRVFVIDSDKDKVKAEIEVGARPNSLQIDAQNNLWVLCGGQYKADWKGLEVSASLHKINPKTLKVVKKYSFNDLKKTASDLVIDEEGKQLYFLKGGKVFRTDVPSSGKLSPQLFFEGRFYGLGYNKKAKQIFASDAKDYKSRGEVLMIDKTGKSVGKIAAGIIPNGGFHFPK